jgi:hypothetical protein
MRFPGTAGNLVAGACRFAQNPTGNKIANATKSMRHWLKPAPRPDADYNGRQCDALLFSPVFWHSAWHSR